MKRDLIYLVLVFFGAIALFDSMGCSLLLPPLSHDPDYLFTGGCFEHSDGRELGHLDFNNLDDSYSFRGIAKGLSELGVQEEDIWVFSGHATHSEVDTLLASDITATWDNADDSPEEFELEGFYTIATERLIIRHKNSVEEVSLVKVSCIPDGTE